MLKLSDLCIIGNREIYKNKQYKRILPVRLYKRLVALTCCFFTLKNNIFIHRRRLFHTECSFKKYSQGSQFKVEIYHFKLLFKRKYSGFFMFDK